MKKIYFVRHGESEGNAFNTHQSEKTPLTEVGQVQTKTIAWRFSKTKADLIIASPCLRAQQTAQVIANKNNLKIETNDLFTEKKGPSQLFGLSQQSELSKKIRKEIRAHTLDQNGHWQYSDEETAFELIQRTSKALQYLSQRPEENLIVVSHALTLKMILAQILYPTNNLKDLLTIYRNFQLDNTGLSVAFYDEQEKKWEVICINDHSHLG